MPGFVLLQDAMQLEPWQRQKIVEFRDEFLQERAALVQERLVVQEGLQAGPNAALFDRLCNCVGHVWACDVAALHLPAYVLCSLNS